MGTIHLLFPPNSAPQIPQPEDFVQVGSAIRRVLKRAQVATTPRFGERLEEIERYLESVPKSHERVKEFSEGFDFIWNDDYFINKVMESSSADWDKHPELYSALLQEARDRFSWTPPPG